MIFPIKQPPFTFIIRASMEATVESLKAQLTRQISKRDTLILMDDEVSFEEKLKQGYELAVEIDNEFSVFIDGDILLRSNAVNRIRKEINKLSTSDLGFGLSLWDRFYDCPKYRGLHVYKTKFLAKAILVIPQEGKELRPESFVKNELSKQGHQWKGGITSYVAGLHDYYQYPKDIFYKFIIRSQRSKNDIEFLKNKFKKKSKKNDFKYALLGLNEGLKQKRVTNNKKNYEVLISKIMNKSVYKKPTTNFLDAYILLKLFKRYKFGRRFWSSI